jgi:hypothetical protein
LGTRFDPIVLKLVVTDRTFVQAVMNIFAILGYIRVYI